jgi:hypothetical protein
MTTTALERAMSDAIDRYEHTTKEQGDDDDDFTGAVAHE